MKRILPIIVALVALLVPAAMAEGNRLLEIGENEYLYSLLSDGEALYAVGDSSLYVWREGDEAFTAWDRHLSTGEGEEISEEELDSLLYDGSFVIQNGRLRGLRLLRNDLWELEGLQLYDLALGDNQTLKLENLQNLAMPGALAERDDFYISGLCASGDVLYILCEAGGTPSVFLLDLENPRDVQTVDLTGWDYQLIPAANGALLVERQYESDRTLLTRIDSRGDVEEVCALPYRTTGIAEDAETGALYATVEGRASAMDAAAGELGAPFGAVPLEARYGVALGGGKYYAVAMDGAVALLDTDGQLPEDSVLTVAGNAYESWFNSAVLKYAVEHPEAAPVLTGERESVISDMLSHSPDTDIYILNIRSSADYSAALERGYALPLDSSEALAALADRIYPGVLDGLRSGGALVALPLSVTSRGMAVGTRLLEKLGLSADDVPRDWPGFIDFLEDEIRPRVDELGEAGKFTYDMDADSFRYYLISQIMQDFVNASNAAGQLPNYEDPRLVDLLDRLRGIDFTEYGLAEPSEDGSYGFSYGGESYLIQMNMNYGFEDWGEEIEGEPLLLGFGDDLPGVVPLDVVAAFVNPYSRHAEAAMAFLESLAERLPDETLYMLCPDLNEPVESPYAVRIMTNLREDMEAVQENIEKAATVDRQSLENVLESLRQEYEDYQENGLWLIPQDRLEWYRAQGDRLYVTRPNWFEKDDSGEANALMEQFYAGQLSAREFLAAVNQKARMMAMEG